MTPLSPSGALGFRDWQREQPWDGPAILSESQVAHVGNVVDPIADVSRWGYLGGEVRGRVAAVELDLDWYLDQAATLHCGARQIIFHPTINTWANLRIPHLGPWLKCTWLPLSTGTNWTRDARLFNTNRSDARGLIPQMGPLMNFTNLAIPAGGVLTTFPNQYYAGPVRVYAYLPVSYALSVQVEGPVGVFSNIYNLSMAANTEAHDSFLVPAGSWQLLFRNTGASTQNADLGVMPSDTGSA